MSRLERSFQASLIRELASLFPGSVVLKNDSGYIQGIPDLTILYGDRWAMLEVKKSLKETSEPNQTYYVDLLDDMSFARFICPENKKEVLRALQQKLSGSR